MIDDGIKSALLPLNYNIGASGREEYKGKQGAVALTTNKTAPNAKETGRQ